MRINKRPSTAIQSSDVTPNRDNLFPFTRLGHVVTSLLGLIAPRPWARKQTIWQATS